MSDSISLIPCQYLVLKLVFKIIIILAFWQVCIDILLILICIFLKTNNIKHIFMWFPSVYPHWWPFMSFAIFTGLLNFETSLYIYILNSSLLSIIWFVSTFSHSDFLFILLTKSSSQQKFLSLRKSKLLILTFMPHSSGFKSKQSLPSSVSQRFSFIFFQKALWF